jgi:carboxyl-terminal processing protease
VQSGLDDETFVQTMREMLGQLPSGKANYLTRAERLALETQDTGRYQGIGAFIAFRETPEPHVVILSIIRDSPADQAGLQAHDSIYAIDGQPVQSGEGDTVAGRIRGPAESSVTLLVQSPGQARREVVIPRQVITTTDSLRGGYVEAFQVAYYRIPVLADTQMPTIIAQDLNSIPAGSALKGIILDLRVAGAAGQGWPLGDMLSLFGDGHLGEFYTRTTTDTVSISGENVRDSQTAPLILLIGPDTRGSVEVFAGALHGAGRAVLLGLPTAGQIERFSEVPLFDGSRLRLATASFRTAGGVDLAATGLKPDFQVTGDWDMVSNEEDPVVGAALDLLLR